MKSLSESETTGLLFAPASALNRLICSSYFFVFFRTGIPLSPPNSTKPATVAGLGGRISQSETVVRQWFWDGMIFPT
jgi:hypothetical protein